MTIGYVFKAEFWLPETAANYLGFFDHPFDITTFTPISPGHKKRSIADDILANDTVDSVRGYDNEQNEHFEKHTAQVKVESGKIVDPEQDKWDAEKAWFEDEQFDRSKNAMFIRKPQNYATSRWTLYKGFAALAERYDA